MAKILEIPAMGYVSSWMLQISSSQRQGQSWGHLQTSSGGCHGRHCRPRREAEMGENSPTEMEAEQVGGSSISWHMPIHHLEAERIPDHASAKWQITIITLIKCQSSHSLVLRCLAWSPTVCIWISQWALQKTQILIAMFFKVPPHPSPSPSLHAQ